MEYLTGFGNFFESEAEKVACRRGETHLVSR